MLPRTRSSRLSSTCEMPSNPSPRAPPPLGLRDAEQLQRVRPVLPREQDELPREALRGGADLLAAIPGAARRGNDAEVRVLRSLSRSGGGRPDFPRAAPEL